MGPGVLENIAGKGTIVQLEEVQAGRCSNSIAKELSIRIASGDISIQAVKIQNRSSSAFNGGLALGQ